MARDEWSRERILKVSGSYWEAFALHAGVRLDVFSFIGDRELNAEQVAEGLNCDLRGVSRLLNALAAMGLLVKSEQFFANSDSSKALLNKGSGKYLGHILKHHHYLVGPWSRLHEAVRTGRPVREKSPIQDDELESFLMGMYNMATGIAPEVSRSVDLMGKKHLLDLGGGPGTYAVHFCTENPELMATVYDLGATRPFAEKTIEHFGLSERVTFKAGDYLKEGLIGSYDVAWLSHILHGVGPEKAQKIISNAVSVLEKGGLILIHDFMLNENSDGPLFPALFSLNMLVNTMDGMSYSEEHLRDMMSAAGVRDISTLPFVGPNDSRILLGKI